MRPARVLVVGVGGLGSPVALALCREPAVGSLTLIDPDCVELSNLHRQILLGPADLDRPKVVAAAATLASQPAPRTGGSQLLVRSLFERLTAARLAELAPEHDLIIEGSDDLGTKFVVSDGAWRCRLPAVIGGIVRWSGQLLTVWPTGRSATGGPLACYRCLFEEPPADGVAASCQQAGVLGPACGVVGGLMATEALAVLRGQPAYAGAVLTIDLLRWRLRRVAIGVRPGCSGCGRPTG